jgi:hypothetical protein
VPSEPKKTAAPVALSADTERRLSALFEPKDRNAARSMLVKECGAGMGDSNSPTDAGLERIRFAALKLSEGRLDKLRQAIELGKQDFRDLLMASGFGHDPKAHLAWTPSAQGGTRPDGGVS